MTPLRPAQAAILEYTGGTMGIAAVPGSGKTWTLSQLAVSLIRDGRLQPRQEVLIVTLVNSAVDNFRQRIAGFLREEGLLPGLGYRVRTLHSLAHEIVSQTPSLAGLETSFSVVDERIGDAIMSGAFSAAYSRYERLLQDYLIEDLSEFKRQQVLEQVLPDELKRVVGNAISHLKNRRVTPLQLRERITSDSPVLVHLAADVYERYQHGLDTRGAVDFGDLITAALKVLELDPSLAEGLRQRWPYVLEDEAQDSSALQELILRHLVGEGGNWVRVGDPNQAIYETFTTAHPRYLRQFLEKADVKRELPNSGRSGLPIIELANELIRFVREDHPIVPMRAALDLPLIEPTPAGDPQPNPEADACQVGFDFRGDSPEQELDRVIASARRWLVDHAEATVAVLVPTNSQAAKVINALEEAGVPYSDALLRLTTSTREAAGALSLILQHLARPEAVKPLLMTYRVWHRRVLGEAETLEGQDRMDQHASLLEGCQQTELFIWPAPGATGLEFADEPLPSAAADYLGRFREQLQRWHGLVLLPIGELLVAIAQDLFAEPEKLAMTQLFAEILSERSQFHLGSERRPATLDDLRRELVVIARDERKMQAIETDKTGFDPESHCGEVVVATMHGAKGLEWDRVYLLAVNDYEFPGGHSDEPSRSERWYVRDRLNLEAETMALLEAELDQTSYQEAVATKEACRDYARERLRLLYVGITRARQELLVTADVGPRGRNKPAVAFEALQTFAQASGDSTESDR